LKAKKTQKDSRVSIKIDQSLWKVISEAIKSHPEWGIFSVSEFIRRAIDHELTARQSSEDRKIIQIVFDDPASKERNSDRDS